MNSRVPQRSVLRPARRLFALAGVLLVLYALNVAAGMAAVKLGVSMWRLGDVGEFVLVLAAMAVFVAGLLVNEERAGVGSEVNPTQGGKR